MQETLFGEYLDFKENQHGANYELHESAITPFTKWLQQDGGDPAQADLRDYVEWSVENTGLSYHEIRNKLWRPLGAFYKWLDERDGLDPNPFTDVDTYQVILSEPVLLWINDIKAKNKPGTWKKRISDITHYCWWCHEHLGKDIVDVDKLEFRQYLQYLNTNTKVGDRVVHDRYYACKGLYDELVDIQEIVEENPVTVHKISEYCDLHVTKRSKETHDDVTYITPQEKEELIAHLPRPRYRNELIVRLLFQTGIRQSELVNIRVKDVKTEQQMIKIRRRKTEGKTKRSANDEVFYQPTLSPLMKTWMSSKRAEFSMAYDSEYLFPTHRSEQLYVQRVNEIIREAAWNAGIQEVMYTDAAGRNRHRVTGHCLRHSFAVQAVKNGMDIRRLQDLLAHSKISQTEIYLQFKKDDLRREAEKYGPGRDQDFENA